MARVGPEWQPPAEHRHDWLAEAVRIAGDLRLRVQDRMPASDDAERVLIVNADDFGLSPGVNAGVAARARAGDRHERQPDGALPAAARGRGVRARGLRGLSLGLHVDLGEWVYNGRGWAPSTRWCRSTDPDAVVDEVGRQVEAFRRLIGRDPSHIDSHQHVHNWDTVVASFRTLALALGVPLRQHEGVDLLRRPVRPGVRRDADPRRDHRRAR